MPQYVAAEEGHTDIVKYFVEQGAIVNITDRTGVSWPCPLLMLLANYQQRIHTVVSRKNTHGQSTLYV